MAVVIGIVSERDLSIHMCHEKYSKLVLYKLLLHCNSHLKTAVVN